MAHQFVVNATIKGVSLDDFRRLAANISLHENVCRRIPGEKLEILESNKVGDIYTLKRAYNLVVLSSEVRLDPNLPLEAVCQRSVSGNDKQIHFQLEWTVKVKVPLIGGMLEKHAEGEIRKFSQIELDIVEDELRQNLHAETLS